MKLDTAVNNEHQTRVNLQKEKTSCSADWHDMTALGTVIDSLLKCTGFRDRARRNCHDYRLIRNEVYLPDLPCAFDGYTILHLSDLHADGLLDDGEGIMRIVEAVPCDLAVMTGDFSFEDSGSNSEICLESLVPIARTIRAQDGIYGILGNHDLLEMVPSLEQMGIRMLLNDAVRLRRGTAEVLLAGVDDPHFYKCHNLQKALSGADQDHCIILLSHSPEIAAEASRCGVDFYLCGHTHGGQICLPGGIALFANTPSCLRRYVAGSWNCGSMKGYTSRGTGFSLTAARFFCPPEITLHTLHSGSMPRDYRYAVEEHAGAWFNGFGNAVFA